VQTVFYDVLYLAIIAKWFLLSQRMYTSNIRTRLHSVRVVSPFEMWNSPNLRNTAAIRKQIKCLNTLWRTATCNGLLGISTSQLRRLQLDLIYCYNIIFGIVAVECNTLFTLNTFSTTRGHAYKLYKPQCTYDFRSNFFWNRVINIWNSLPASVNFASLTSFKRSLKCVELSAYFTEQ